MSSTPEPPRRYVVDLTAADAEAVITFLQPRLSTRDFDTPEYKMAFALDGITRRAWHTVSHQSQVLAADSFRDGLERLRCLHALQNAWNILWQAVFPWRREEGYDTARWVHIEYIDEEDAARGEALKAEVDEELRAEKAAAEQAEGSGR